MLRFVGGCEANVNLVHGRKIRPASPLHHLPFGYVEMVAERGERVPQAVVSAHGHTGGLANAIDVFEQSLFSLRNDLAAQI